MHFKTPQDIVNLLSITASGIYYPLIKWNLHFICSYIYDLIHNESLTLWLVKSEFHCLDSMGGFYQELDLFGRE